ncbi:ABC transporter ATP-binding protein [Ruminococcus sp. CLA-AA-H200]|uniref:ABC transporter ATP-binding protein n=1 Tax=Ruminococcus turbiniformis TaxID=2881258 RepID=A0ABS8G068_9FIRM|nr:ABC transporter ATP-binding protein [Ruminococcus turbiniformis]MCC2255695.1 ABC transporter ATP-binding protein [Ruminococcus turbiniformis]
MNIIITKNLRKIYRMGENNVYALNGVDFTVKEGEFVAIAGASGSGKSTLLNLLGAMDSPTEGEIFVRRIPLAQLSQNEQTIFRRRNIGFIFQDFKLLPVLNVYDNMVLPLKLDGRKIDQEFAEMLLKSLGLQDKREQTPYTLSGGEQQRVAIARALITRPAVVLADEPTGNLDSRTGMEVIGLMKLLAQKFYQTLVVVTHDEEVAQMADRIVRIEDGKICQEGECI